MGIEIRFNRCGRYVAVSCGDLERLTKKYLANGGFAGHGYPFAVFVTIEATKLLERADAANPGPGRPWKFTGRFEQFSSRGKVLSGFILLKFEPCEEAELRTAFIPTGELMGKEYPDDTPDFTVLNLKVIQGRGERTEEKTFRLYAPWSMAEGMDVGAAYQLNGRIVDEDREFGSSGVTMPLVMVVKARRGCSDT